MVNKINRRSYKGKNNPMYGKKRPDVVLRNSLNPRFGSKNYFYGKELLGKLNGNWKGGKPKCKDCGKEIGWKHIRCIKCSNTYRSGNKSSTWLSGLAKYLYYKFTPKLKESIRKRDNYTCQNCNKKQKNLYRKLDIHHIDYNKKNCSKKNLISLCSGCNIKANFNRDYWYAFFTYILGVL